MTTSTPIQTALPGLNDPSLPVRLAAELEAKGDLAHLVLIQHDDEGHHGPARSCDRAACRRASEERRRR